MITSCENCVSNITVYCEYQMDCLQSSTLEQTAQKFLDIEHLPFYACLTLLC
jgi:hypothetical protein